MKRITFMDQLLVLIFKIDPETTSIPKNRLACKSRRLPRLSFPQTYTFSLSLMHTFDRCSRRRTDPGTYYTIALLAWNRKAVIVMHMHCLCGNTSEMACTF